MNKLKKRLMTLFTAVIISSFALVGSASATSGDGGWSYWFYDGSGCCAMLYFAPAGGGEHIFTGMYQDSNGEVFYYAVQ
ncbi:hypothetical protein [Paenibacillus daejeonensis]|uniref:hypothetical protein n=1 Tax=Paenibacillus daejeonensis TaxID=135193 RepID=UPI00036BBD76|nr:hypothetical protein [Paenibacillus daejeonensis]